ncbi:MAG: hypothetical protein HYX80_04915, partial [Chloroflexi bacterium]|nr:hypothetical protein [Chloroflexota bacterium]
DLGIDQLLFKDVAPGATYPGRPSPQTSFAFVLTGISVLLWGGRLWMLWAGQVLGVAVGFVALTATIGYVYKSFPLYGITPYTGMALHTALAFMALSFSIVFSKADRGLPALFARGVVPTSSGLPHESPSATRLASVFRQSSLFASIVAVIIAGTIFFGGLLFNDPNLKSLAPGLPMMMPNASVGEILAGVSLFLGLVIPSKRSVSWIARFLAASVFIIGLATAVEYIFNVDLLIDELFFKDISSGAAYPGRLSPETTIALTFIGFSLLLFLAKTRSWMNWASQALAFGAGMAAVTVIMSYVYGALQLYVITPYTGTSIACAVSVLSISSGIILAQVDRGPAALLASEKSGGVIARWLLPATIVIPFARGVISLWNQNSGLLPGVPGLVAESALTAALWVVLFGIVVRVLNQVDTARQAATEALKERSVQLENANEELRAFSYSVAHDLRAPLRSTVGFSQVLAEDYASKLDEQGKQYLKWIQESGEVMAQLIDDMLQLSRVTTAEIHETLIDLTELSQFVLDELKKTEPDRRVEIVVSPGIICVGDRQLMRHVMQNLLRNAWKFTGKAAQPRIEVGAITRDGERAYFVRDNGAGFDMAYADKLFKPFQRLHRAEEFAGTGIGLAIVQRIIRRHGGQVWAEGEVDKGATFYFSLP